jgi:hypothetical protein
MSNKFSIIVYSDCMIDSDELVEKKLEESTAVTFYIVVRKNEENVLHIHEPVLLHIFSLY